MINKAIFKCKKEIIIRRKYLSLFLFLSFYGAIFLFDVVDKYLIKFIANNKSFLEILFNFDVFLPVFLLLLVVHSVYLIATGFYVKEINIDNKIQIKLFSGKNYDIYFKDLESFDINFSKFWGWEYFLYKHKTGKILKIITEIDNKDDFKKVISSKLIKE